MRVDVALVDAYPTVEEARRSFPDSDLPYRGVWVMPEAAPDRPMVYVFSADLDEAALKARGWIPCVQRWIPCDA